MLSSKNNTTYSKKSHTSEETTTLQNFFWQKFLIDNLEKQLFITKNCWSQPIKSLRILIFTMLYFSKKWKKTPGNIIIIPPCTKHLDGMIYSSWNMEYDRLKLVILGHFLAFNFPKNPKKIKIKKNVKIIARDIIILYVYHHNHMMYSSWDMRLAEFLVILGQLLTFYPTNNLENQNLKKWKKPLEMPQFYTFVPKT